MNVVDTSGWLEYFEGGQNAKKFSAPIKEIEKLLVPTICIYEISKIILRVQQFKKGGFYLLLQQYQLQQPRLV